MSILKYVDFTNSFSNMHPHEASTDPVAMKRRQVWGDISRMLESGRPEAASQRAEAQGSASAKKRPPGCYGAYAPTFTLDIHPYIHSKIELGKSECKEVPGMYGICWTVYPRCYVWVFNARVRKHQQPAPHPTATPARLQHNPKTKPTPP